MTVALVAAALFVVGTLVLAVALCRAAARGDEWARETLASHRIARTRELSEDDRW